MIESPSNYVDTCIRCGAVKYMAEDCSKCSRGKWLCNIGWHSWRQRFPERIYDWPELVECKRCGKHDRLYKE